MLLETNGLPRQTDTLDKVQKHLAGISALVDLWWQTVRQDLTQLAMTPRWTQWAADVLLPLMYWQEQLRRTRHPGHKAQIALVLQAVEEVFERPPCTRQLKPELLVGWKAWRRSMPRRSSGRLRRWKVATALSRRCSTTIAAYPRVAIRCGRCCTIAIVGPRTGRHRRRGFSGGRFPICSRACCHRLTRCPGPGGVVRPSRQVIEGAGCPA